MGTGGNGGSIHIKTYNPKCNKVFGQLLCHQSDDSFPGFIEHALEKNTYGPCPIDNWKYELSFNKKENQKKKRHSRRESPMAFNPT